MNKEAFGKTGLVTFYLDESPKTCFELINRVPATFVRQLRNRITKYLNYQSVNLRLEKYQNARLTLQFRLKWLNKTKLKARSKLRVKKNRNDKKTVSKNKKL